MKLSAFENCPFKRVAVLVLVITMFIGTLMTLFTDEVWYIIYLYTFTFTTACSFFVTLLLCYFYERIEKYSKPLYLILFIILVLIGTLFGAEMASLIMAGKFLLGRKTLLFTIMVSFIASGAITMYQQLRKNIEDNIARLKEVELENERLKRYELQARLESLQAKLNPHFLFNTLNSTAALVYEDPQKAEYIIIRLSELYQKVLDTTSRSFITISDEIELIENYLELEKVRFDSKLVYFIKCPSRLKGRRIPSLLIEPLVENSIKHALNRTEDILRIEIDIEEKANNIFIAVRDNGPGFDVEKADLGFGLFCIQEKLRLLFEQDYEFDIRSVPGKETVVLIRIPLEFG